MPLIPIRREVHLANSLAALFEVEDGGVAELALASLEAAGDFPTGCAGTGVSASSKRGPGSGVCAARTRAVRRARQIEAMVHFM